MSHPLPSSSPHPPTPSPHPPMVVSEAVLRRRSADIGGLHLAIRYKGQGLGWLDSTSSDTIIATEYAELCATMYRETLRLVENNTAQNDFPQLEDEDLERLLKTLESWYFEPLSMPEHELLACVLSLFQVLFRIEGMTDAIKVDMAVIPRFILHIRQLYRYQNHYHNFEHAVDVLQAIHCYLRAAGMVPSVLLLLKKADEPGGMWSSTREPDSGPLVTCLTPHEIFALYLAAIGHDVGHPGFNNPFMKNAEAPLSQVYDNQSALEQMHSYLLIMAMKQHGLGVLLDDPQTGPLFRKILKSSVLATDMGVHQAFMNEFAQILDGITEASNGIVKWQTSKCGRQTFICQLLLKNADISNPCRPFLVSKQWASALQQEWACQYKFESFLQLEHAVKPSNEPLAEANSQVFFTKNMAKGLVDMTTIAIPELRQYTYHCAENLREWERILKELEKAQEAIELSSSEKPSNGASAAPRSATSSQPLSAAAAAAAESASPGRQDTTTSYPSENTLSSHPYKSPVTLSTTSISASSSISSSSSNPVSPRNTENDYSTAFRLALPRIKPDGSSLSPAGTPVSTSGSMIGSALSMLGANASGRNKISRTPSSSSGGTMSPGGSAGIGGGVLSPSLSRAAATAAAAAATRVMTSGSPSSTSPKTISPSRYSNPNAPEDRMHMDGYRFPLNSSSPTPSTLNPAPPPPPPADPIGPYYAHHLRQYSRSQANNHNNNSQPNSQSHSSTPSVSPSESRSQVQDPDAEDQQSHQGLGDGLEESVLSDSNGVGVGGGSDEYERDVQAHRFTFNQAIGLGLGVGSLKKQKSSSNVLRSLPFVGYSPSPTSSSSVGVGVGVGGAASPISSTSAAVLGVATLPSLSFGFNNNHSPGNTFVGRGGGGGYGCGGTRSSRSSMNRASWCGAMEEDWRGRWGSESFAYSTVTVRKGGGGGSRAVADEGSEGEGEGEFEEDTDVSHHHHQQPNHERSTADIVAVTQNGGGEEEEEEEAESIPTGLVSPAPISTTSSSSSPSSFSPDPGLVDPDPKTPPQQIGSLDSENRSGSPTPKAKSLGLEKMRETDAQRRKRLEEEERKAEQRREKIREDLIRQDEKEKLKKKKTLESLRVNGGGTASGGKGSAGRSRSKSKNRKKGTKGT